LKNSGFLLLLAAIFILTIFTSPLALAANYNLVKKWGSQGIGDGQFNRPAGIAYDSTDGIVYVLDTMNNRVQKFDTEGNFLSKWGLPGKGNGQFSDPTGIVLDSVSNLIYITDNDNHRVQG
jgi:DNA-binding beta-propeller fold protein YncE